MPEAVQPRFELHGLTDTGQVREDNQDAIRFTHPEDLEAQRRGHLFAVADGMGGYSHGSVASNLALETLFDIFYGDPEPSALHRLKRGVQKANVGVYQEAARRGIGKMGTTLTAIHLAGRQLNVAHVGDSRLYLIRGGKAACLTNDHTRVGELVRLKLLSPDKLRTHNQRSILNRSLGLELFIQPDIFTVQLQKDDMFVLCTDGVWGLIEDQDFATYASGAASAEDYNHALLEEALRRGSDDNLSLVSLRLNALGSGIGQETPGGFAAFLARLFRR